MLGYHLFIAWKSIRRTPKHSLVIVASIALGVAVATLFSVIRHTYARDPIPEKSSSLHYVRLDSWDPRKAYEPDGIPPVITYQDMLRIMRSDIPARQTGTFRSFVRLALGDRKAMDTARYCHSDFFTMFDVPFRYGSAWDRKADLGAEPVVVLSEELNNAWFGGENSVGRTLQIEGRDFRVVGVLDHFQPWIRYYDLTEMSITGMPEGGLYIPMSSVPILNGYSVGSQRTWKADGGPAERLSSERVFIQMWVELPGPEEFRAYRAFLDAYAMDQRRSGRFLRPINNRVTPLLEYMEERGCPPPEATAMMIAANLFLSACALGLMGLLLSRFLSRAAEIGVRRALGASRWDIFVLHVIECELLSVLGGILGLVLSIGGLWLVDMWFKAVTDEVRDSVFQMDLTMMWFGMAASLCAGFLAGVYPAYRVCRVAPASHLKIG